MIAPDGALAPQSSHTVALEDYEATLSPALIGWYERLGYCWVVTRLNRVGPRAREPSRRATGGRLLPRARRPRAGRLPRLALRVRVAAPPAFNFDWTFDYYPLAYAAPVRR